MKEDKIREALRSFSVQEYISASRVNGRHSDHMDLDVRARAAKLYAQICEFKSKEPFLSVELEVTLELAQRVLFSEWFLLNSEEPRYPAYTNVRVLNWVLGTNGRANLRTVWSRCWFAIGLLLQDLLSHEVCSLAGVEHWNQVNCDRDVLVKRIHLLQELRGRIGGTQVRSSPLVNLDQPPDDWFSYGLDRARALALLHLTALPQTQEHDEVLFLRTIHISECCFWGILTGVLGAMEHAKVGEMDIAVECLTEAVAFAELLVPLFQAFKSMPPKHFTMFRDATGDASAIQSRTYQLMQIFVQGLDERKAPIMADIPEVADLVLYGHPRFVTLRSLLASIEANGLAGSAEFVANAEALDRALYAWRCLHLGIAREYLPPATTGTGGTRGATLPRYTLQTENLSHDPSIRCTR